MPQILLFTIEARLVVVRRYLEKSLAHGVLIECEDSLTLNVN